MGVVVGRVVPPAGSMVMPRRSPVLSPLARTGAVAAGSSPAERAPVLVMTQSW